MIKSKYIGSIVTALCGVFFLSDARSAVAQASSSVLCSSTSTGLVVARNKCRRGETRVNPLTDRFKGCYWRLGTPVALDGQTGQVTISESCTTGDVLLNHSVSHNSSANGVVQISSVAFTQPPSASHTLPQGVTVKINLVNSLQPPIPSGSNVNAEVNLLCCPFR